MRTEERYTEHWEDVPSASDSTNRRSRQTVSGKMHSRHGSDQEPCRLLLYPSDFSSIPVIYQLECHGDGRKVRPRKETYLCAS